MRALTGWGSAVLLASALVIGGGGAHALESEWSKIPGSAAQARLVAGTIEEQGGAKLYAFLDIEMGAGWKTYWRNPGDAGGLPPLLDFSQSQNVEAATVYFPAPHRFTDKSGTTIGYKERVLFPVDIAVKDASKPLVLHLEAQYGLCKDVCIPAEATFDLEVPPGTLELPEEAVQALAKVPRPPQAAGPGAPRLAGVKAELQGEKPRLVLEAEFPAGEEGADLFLEAPDSLFIPVPARTGGTGGKLTFEADLSDGADIAALKGKTLLATIVSAGGQSITPFKLD